MQLATNTTATINYALNTTAAKAVTGKADVAKKIGLFVAILACVVAAMWL